MGVGCHIWVYFSWFPQASYTPSKSMKMLDCDLALKTTILYSVAVLSSCEGSTYNEAGQKLNVLVISDYAYGHMAPMLPIGEELVRRGHNVTLLLIVPETEQEKYRRHIEKHGIYLWNVSSEDFQIDSAKELVREISQDFFWSSVKLGQMGAKYMKIMAKHMNGSLSTGHWDIVLANHFMHVLTSCMQSTHDVPFVMIGHFPFAFHFIPSWPWPGLLQ